MADILIIDDDDMYRDMLKITLTNMGHKVTTSTGYEQALSECDRSAFQLVLTDIVMPGRDGLEIIETLKERWPEMAVIAMSGSGQIVTTKYLRTATERGADGVLDKPFTNQQLASTLAKVLKAFGVAPN